MRWFHWVVVFLWALIFGAAAQIGPPSQSFTGNAYAGRCSFDGTAIILPSAYWSCARISTGVYDIRTPSGYDARNYAIVVSISGNWEGVIQAYAPGTGYFRVSIIDRATGAYTDGTFGFVVTRNATIYP